MDTSLIPDTIRKTRHFSRIEMETRILKAAEEVFALCGFDGASTAEIAKRAGIPKANLHYYFKTKEDLYRRLMEDINLHWQSIADKIQPENDPALVLADYIRNKINLARARPLASKVYAGELLRGAPLLKDYIAVEVKDWLGKKAQIIQQWVDEGKIAPVDPYHLFFLLWCSTQTYADFSVQMELILGKPLEAEDYRKAAEQLAQTLIHGLVTKN